MITKIFRVNTRGLLLNQSGRTLLAKNVTVSINYESFEGPIRSDSSSSLDNPLTIFHSRSHGKRKTKSPVRNLETFDIDKKLETLSLDEKGIFS